MTSPHTFVPVPPNERPRVRRRTARVLLIDDLDRLLLFGDSDPGLPGSGWWITPGGGVDGEETDLEAAVRELGEETGLQVDGRDLLGPIVVRAVVHGYTDVIIDQEDVFYACWTQPFDVSDAGHTEEEKLTLSTHHWWTRSELATTADVVWPVSLLDLWDDADGRRGQPERPPVRGPGVEESSVPI